MARVDSLLSILTQQGANELRLGTDKEPKMFAFGTPKRLHIPSTPEDTLRELLGEILTPEREQILQSPGGRVDASYEAQGLGSFYVKLSARAGGGFDVMFHRETAKRGAAPAPAPATAPATATATATAPAPAPATTTATETETGTTPAIALATAPMPVFAPLAPNDALANLVATALAHRASDLHLADGAPAVCRVDGSLRTLGDYPLDLLATLALGPAREERLAAGHSIDLGIDVPGAGRARVHVFRTQAGLAASVRLLPSTAPALSALHLPVPLDDLIDLPHGLVLVCGATGSGKSTTLAALAQEALRRRSIVLTTLEDPIEYGLVSSDRSLVRRREVGQDVRDFPTGLRDALREDPDVLLVGEMRDPQTIGLALTAAETGHLVLSSLHCRTAGSAVERIADSYPAERQGQIRVQLADALRAVVVQRLLPRARGGGRVPCLEVLRVTHAVSAMVREGKTAQLASAIQSGRREGMISLERSLADRVHAGDIRIEDARAAANEPESLAMFLKSEA